MQCPDCLGYRHDGPCENLHTAYLDAFATMMEYLDTLHPTNRTLAQTEKLSRLTSICDMAKYRWETSQMRNWQHEQVG